jgi:hypothetical protein
MSDPLADFLVAARKLRDQWRDEDEQEGKDCGEEEYEPPPCWFRGVSRVDYKLEPKLYRPTGYHLRKYPRQVPDENEITSGFKHRAAQLMTELRLPANDKEWYFLMQHFRAPTRLLDWTDGALLGLYFAVRTLKEPRDVAVWVLDPAWLNAKTLKDSVVEGIALPEWKETDPWFPQPFEETLHPALPLAIDPPHVARRVAVQRSHFTIHGTEKDGLDRMVSEPGARLVKLTVRAGDVVTLLDDLETCGITETTVFPELEGLSLELMREWAEA